MIIMKFGGRTLATAERIHQVGNLIRQKITLKPIIIISALAGITDQLETLAEKTAHSGKVSLIPIYQKHQSMLRQLGLNKYLLEPFFRELEVVFKGISLLRELTPRTLDYILSFGERFAACLVAAYLRKQGMKAHGLDAFQIGLITDSNFGNARPLPESIPFIRKHLLPYRELPVITGFIGKDKAGEITTLGRDGSDYSASFIGAALGVREIQIWRDLPGIMTADPQMVKTARLVKHITLEEASELVYYGNGVLHPYMLAPAVDKRIPVRILNIFQQESEGTLIINSSRDKKSIKTIAYKNNVLLINIVSPEIFHHRRLAINVFEILSRYGIFFHLLASSEISISFVTVPDIPHLTEALREISDLAKLNVLKNKSIVCIIGEGIKDNQKVMPKIFTGLSNSRIKVEMIIHNVLKTNLTFIINKRDINRAVNNTHKLLFT